MAHLIGRGRYKGESYPISAAVGSGGGGSNPLSRQRFIDGGTTSAGPGAAGAPFKTIADFIASRTTVSPQDSVSNYVGWLMPSLNGYTEDVNFPPYVSTELRADSLSGANAGFGGVVVVGDLNWNNAAGAQVGAAALVTLHNIAATGTLNIVDDVNAPPSAVAITSDEVSGLTSSIGAINCRTTTKLQQIFISNSSVLGGINADNVRANAAAVICNGAQIVGAIAASALDAINSAFGSPSINTFGLQTYARCTFGLGTTPLITTTQAEFDGSSWISFVEAGGTRAVGTIVVVDGGADGALVEGALLPTTGVNTNVSFDGSGASVGFTGENCGNHYSSTGLAADGASVTFVPSAIASTGDTMVITKTDLAAHALTINNGGATPSLLATIPSGNRGFVKARFDGLNFVLVEIGTSPS